eukprot:TRINITY_DN112708_c0_g1_i1.p1 TRINITY_DN112708_c0_g1~~TRINITY_DN112708_c0_g1_i1.p1  ORF type:complete len:410 (+),score=61.96 TRINITY_DN112708_c0_g1_i1:59-1288(+)
MLRLSFGCSRSAVLRRPCLRGSAAQLDRSWHTGRSLAPQIVRLSQERCSASVERSVPARAGSDSALLQDDRLQKVLEKAAELDRQGETDIVGLLQRLGVRSHEDLKYLSEDDLTKHGVTVVAARQLLEQAGHGSTMPPAPAASGLFSAEETMKALTNKGLQHAEKPASQVFASSFLGGALLGWGCCLTTVVAGGSAVALANAPGAVSLLGGAVFPVGLSMVLLSGSELLTGNFMTMVLPAWRQPEVSTSTVLSNCLRVWSVSGAGNLAGSLMMALGIYSCSVVAAGSPAGTWLAAAVAKKCALSPLVAIGKGAGANWLVNCAIFQAASAHTAPGKIASLWLPIMTFIALGLEHSVANMFLLPLGWLLGADVTVLSILGNLVPVAIGNALGAIVFVAGIQRFSLLRNMRA